MNQINRQFNCAHRRLIADEFAQSLVRKFQVQPVRQMLLPVLPAILLAALLDVPNAAAGPIPQPAAEKQHVEIKIAVDDACEKIKKIDEIPAKLEQKLEKLEQQDQQMQKMAGDMQNCANCLKQGQGQPKQGQGHSITGKSISVVCELARSSLNRRSDSLENQKLPRSQREHTRQYFENLRGD